MYQFSRDTQTHRHTNIRGWSVGRVGDNGVRLADTEAWRLLFLFLFRAIRHYSQLILRSCILLITACTLALHICCRMRGVDTTTHSHSNHNNAAQGYIFFSLLLTNDFGRNWLGAAWWFSFRFILTFCLLCWSAWTNWRALACMASLAIKALAYAPGMDGWFSLLNPS